AASSILTSASSSRENAWSASVFNRPEIEFADRRLQHHRDRGEPPLPVGGLEPPLDLVDLLAGEAARDDVVRSQAADQVVEDAVHLVVADAVIALGGRPGDEIGRRR